MMLLRDNTSVKQEELSSIPKLRDKLENKTISQLECEGVLFCSFNSRGTKYNPVLLQREANGYKIGNLVGFLSCEGESLRIRSRFGCNDNDNFLKYLLDCVLGFPVSLGMGNGIDMRKNEIEEPQNLFLFVFPTILRNAIRKGVFKTYLRTEYNDLKIRGAINVGRQIAKNTPFIGKFAYRCREYSYDNRVTELVRHTIEYLQTTPMGAKVLDTVQGEVRTIRECTPMYHTMDRTQIILENLRHPVFHLYYEEYRALQQVCIQILHRQSCQVQTESGKKRMFGVIFDASSLWEEYLNTLLKNWFYHPQNRGIGGRPSGCQQYFSRDSEKAKENGTLQKIGLNYPDFIGKNPNDRIIGDAKYKVRNNIHTSDFSQILSYMFRYGANKGFLFYPFSGNDSSNKSSLVETLYLNEGTTFEDNVRARNDVSVRVLGLKIPSTVMSYSGFKEKMKDAESDFLGEIFRDERLSIRSLTEVR